MKRKKILRYTWQLGMLLLLTLFFLASAPVFGEATENSTDAVTSSTTSPSSVDASLLDQSYSEPGRNMHQASSVGEALREGEIAPLQESSSIRNFKPWLEQSNMVGNCYGIRDDLINQGIELGFSSMTDVWGNTTGGIKTGSVSSSMIQFATDINLEKLIGWKGASFYSRWLYLCGQDPSTNLVGDVFTVSNIAGYSTFRNIDLWLEQKLFEDTLSLRVGQLEADSEFIISDYGAVFLNSTFGWPAFMYTSLPNGGPNYPVGAPGVRLKITPTQDFSLKIAAFQGDVYAQNVNNHGFDWNLGTQNGFFYMTEADYKYDLGLPGQVKAGAWFFSGTVPSVSNPNGSFWGNNGFYGIIDQMIYRKAALVDDPNKPNAQGLGVFGCLGFEPEDRNFLDFSFTTGLNYKGLLPKHNEDILAIGMAYGQVSNGARNQSTASSNPTFVPPATGATNLNYEMALEATYQLSVTPWLAIQPDIQYIIHPGASTTLSNALVLGMRATVTFW